LAKWKPIRIDEPTPETWPEGLYWMIHESVSFDGEIVRVTWRKGHKLVDPKEFAFELYNSDCCEADPLDWLDTIREYTHYEGPIEQPTWED
jgi:hypothetical protein